MVDDYSNPSRWVVGPEHDSVLQRNLHVALQRLGYESVASSWGIGGSQEVTTLTVRGPGGALKVEAETYVGLVVEGPPPLVEALRTAYSSMFPSGQRGKGK